MKATIISSFGYYKERVCYVEHVLKKQGYETNFIRSDFDHIKKQKITSDQDAQTLIKVPQYKKNISIKRIVSHLMFSKKVNKVLGKEKPDLIYAILPPNSVGNSLYKYKKRYPETRVMIDIYDLWPESFPFVRNFLFYGWARMRNRIIKTADYTVLECEYYEKLLSPLLRAGRYQVLYLCRVGLQPTKYFHNNKVIEFCYLGSLNHIFDLETTIRLLMRVKKRREVRVHIIGDGEKREKFLKELREKKIPYVYHGIIFEEPKKKDIFKQCHFGLNLYRQGIAIGLTMKSLDYLQAGLPIVNKNIYDTGLLLERYQAGFALSEDNEEEVVNSIVHMTESEWLRLHNNSLLLFNKKFSGETCIKKLETILCTVLVSGKQY